MRFLFLAVLLALPSTAAFAQSRVVGDTFQEGRESHLQSSQEMLQQFQDDGAVMMKERNAAAEEVDAERVTHREKTDAYKKEWDEDWQSGEDQRTANRAEVDQQRAERRTASIAAPGEWWGDDKPGASGVSADDYDDLNQ
ncbi:MAG: hypothetical protein JWO78_911 [Micavibrio sp.]|nr:hypothetical protein [Micavibrio sp.]